MFQVGDYIVYGSMGVCKVENVGPIDIRELSKNKDYYTLVPVYSKGSKVFTPTDNNKVIMRPIIPKEEAMKLIDRIEEIDTIWLDDEKRREQVYKEALRKCDCEECIKIIKTLYQRKQLRIAAGKKATSSDTKYFEIAEECLYGELAISLQMKKDEVQEYIVKRVKVADSME